MDWVIQSLPKELTNENIKKIQIVSKINRPFWGKDRIRMAKKRTTQCNYVKHPYAVLSTLLHRPYDRLFPSGISDRMRPIHMYTNHMNRQKSQDKEEITHVATRWIWLSTWRKWRRRLILHKHRRWPDVFTRMIGFIHPLFCCQSWVTSWIRLWWMTSLFMTAPTGEVRPSPLSNKALASLAKVTTKSQTHTYVYGSNSAAQFESSPLDWIMWIIRVLHLRSYNSWFVRMGSCAVARVKHTGRPWSAN